MIVLIVFIGGHAFRWEPGLVSLNELLRGVAKMAVKKAAKWQDFSIRTWV